MKIAKTIPEILSQTDKKILGRARGVNPTLKGQDGKVVTYEIKGSKDYQVDVEFRGNDVKVRCSCDAFVFQGSEYHANKQKFLYGKARGNLAEPTKRDPDGKNLVCKHIVAVFDAIIGNSVRRVASRHMYDRHASSQTLIDLDAYDYIYDMREAQKNALLVFLSSAIAREFGIRTPRVSRGSFWVQKRWMITVVTNGIRVFDKDTKQHLVWGYISEPIRKAHLNKYKDEVVQAMTRGITPPRPFKDLLPSSFAERRGDFWGKPLSPQEEETVFVPMRREQEKEQQLKNLSLSELKNLATQAMPSILAATKRQFGGTEIQHRSTTGSIRYLADGSWYLPDYYDYDDYEYEQLPPTVVRKIEAWITRHLKQYDWYRYHANSIEVQVQEEDFQKHWVRIEIVLG